MGYSPTLWPQTVRSQSYLSNRAEAVAQFFKKWTILGLSFVHFRLFPQQIYVKKCYDHPVYGAGIQTHDIRNTSLLPIPLDQGSHPGSSSVGRAVASGSRDPKFESRHGQILMYLKYVDREKGAGMALFWL